MSPSARLAILLAVAVASMHVLASDSVHVELLPVTTRTLEESDLLRGRADGGHPDVIAAELAVPLEAEGRLPAVVLLHGSAGVMPYVIEWRERLARMGIASVIVDSYGGRGIGSTIADQDKLPRLNAVFDAYAVLARLRRHPRVDGSRIVVMGFSRGANASLYSALSRFQQAYGDGGSFAAHIAFYPDCTTRYVDETRTDGAPILILHGEADDYAPLSTCAGYVQRLRTAGADVTLKTFPGAHHVFMWSDLAEITLLPTAQTTRNCKLEERQGGIVYAQGAATPFNHHDPCVERGAHVGYQRQAADGSRQAVREFLARVLKLAHH